MLEADFDDHVEPKSNSRRVDQCHIGIDDAGLFQGPDAPHAGGGREADPFGQLEIGDAALDLQHVEDLPVHLVDHDRGSHFFRICRLLRN
ncbi:hypothetical protein ACVIGB_005660 [Bradyrhizobium sp. USDA 4341]